MSESNASLGEAVLDLTAKIDNLEEKLEQAEKVTEGKVESIQKVFSAIAGSAILATIVKAYKQVVAAGEEAAVTEAKVAGVLRATGNAAGYTVGELSQMANEFSKLTGVDDEVILNAEAVLLTFRQIGREVFPEATQAALDMSAVMGQDLQSSIVMIGKALNDPIAGLTALKKVGVTFNDEQENMIKRLVASNDLLGAQQIILDELQSEFGGTAAEMEAASAGGKRLDNAWENLQAVIGERMLPAQRAWNLALTNTLDTITENVDAANQYTDAMQKVAEMHGMTSEELKHATAGSSEFRAEIHRQIGEVQRWTEYGLAWEQRLAAEATGVDALGGALETLDFKGLLDLTMSLSAETARFNQQQDATRLKQAEIKSQIDLLISQGWSPLSQKVKDLQTDYANLGLKYDENALKHQAATNKILYDLFLQKLQVEGVTDAEYEMAIQAGLALDILDQGSVEAAKNFNAVTEAVEDGRLKVEDMKKALDLLPTYKSIDVVIQVLQKYSTQGLINQGVPPSVAQAVGYAEGTGGWLTVPGGYPDDSYFIGLTSGEQYAVMPNVSSPKMPGPAMAGGDSSLHSGGGSMPAVQFIYQPFIGVNDEYEAKNKLRSIFNDLSRESKRQ